MRLILAFAGLLALSFAAHAQTPSALRDGTPLPAAVLNSLFASKLDVGLGLGTGIGQIPQFVNWNGSGFPGLHLTSRLIIDQPITTPTDFAVLQIPRTTTFVGGSASNINQIIKLTGNYGAGDATTEWGLTSTMTTASNTGGEITAGFFQGISLPGATGFNIPLIADYIDQTNLGTLAAHTNGGGALELDMEVNAADDALNGGSFGGTGVRKGLHMVGVRKNPLNLTQTEISNGIWFSTQPGGSTVGPDNLTNFQSVIGFAVNTQIRNALDTRGAITPAGSSNPVSAVTMTAGHVVDFNGGASLTSAPGDYLAWDAATSKLKFYVAGVAKWSVDTAGNIRAAGTVTPSVTP
jgi:hypothetical protein